jgi:hypothetical protein
MSEIAFDFDAVDGEELTVRMGQRVIVGACKTPRPMPLPPRSRTRAPLLRRGPGAGRLDKGAY